MAAQKPYIGGQAVIEGVMMRAPGCMSVAVRRPDGTIAVREGPITSRFAASKAAKLPGLRGVLMLVESMTLGIRALQFSADQQLVGEERKTGGNASALALSLVLFVAVFVALPQALTTGVAKLLGIELGLGDWQFHAVTGGFKLLVFVLYILGVSRIPEMKRVFQYHGAEHKTISAYESGLPLTVDNVRAQSKLHPRCGTTFLVVVVAVSIVVGAVTVPLVLPDAEGFLGQVSVLAVRIGLLPVIAAISYELQRLGARYCTTGPLRVLLWPGFLFQKITTREPDDRQIEIAITAMEAARWRETSGAGTPSDDEPLVFPSFDGFREALPSLRGAPPPALAAAE